ncbi:fatty-acid--CoA ligase FadD4 [Mycobacterium sp. E796]|uniref:fatty-acid--CoA ligase FadD4 n=1 Tax=Mycobacterium sp. E796 TaxID=1834151 RepID=UPI0007FF48FD|nr:fatty-acid--CoA ligase FadD4 [Mycobacterium sp. E796]OBI51976.1 acyl-CoA synthetase [Mycobacterium sp. E796]
MDLREHLTRANPALILHPSGLHLSFDELERRANKLAHYLRDAGLAAADTIAIVMDNNEHMLVAMWAAHRAGLYYVLVSTHLTAHEAAYIVGDCGARAVMGAGATAPLCEGLTEHLGERAPAIRLIADAELAGWHRYPECVAEDPHTAIADESAGDLLQYSSGTTGRPKGIRRELSGAATETAPLILAPLLRAIGIDAGAIYLSPAPLYHTAPAYWSMSVQAVGATAVVMQRFDPVQALAAIERYRVTHAQFVPAMFVRMLKLPESVRRSYDVSSLRRVVHAAAPCPVDIKRQMIDWWGPIIDEYYSSSEAVGVSFITAEEWLAHPGSVGKPLVGVPHILDDDDIELPLGVTGTIFYEGGLPFTYLNDEVKTSHAHSRQGWVTVGDMGHLDEGGYLYLTDRRHHMIISGGVNIYPQEAENLLLTHPKVLDAAVFGVPDRDMGQSVHAAIQLVDPAEAGDEVAAELLEWLRDRLAHYKCPKAIAFEEQLPRTDTGKLFKQQLVTKYSPAHRML